MSEPTLVRAAGLGESARGRWPGWLAPAAVAGVALAGAAVLAAADPSQIAALGPGCPFRVITGLDCPGCGGTRAATALLNGQPLRALDHNPLTVALMPVLTWGWWRWLGFRLGRGSRPTLPPALTMGLAVTLVAFWVLRNVPALAFLGSGVSWSG